MIQENGCAKNAKITCFECEPLLSRACDGECSHDELEVIKEHLKGCPECRRTFMEYREISTMMIARVVTMSCPPLPCVNGGRARFGIISNPRFRRGVIWAAALAACFIFFLAGNYAGSFRVKRDVLRNVSPVAVATPSMWAAKYTAGSELNSSIAAEQPFTESISRYRASIGAELRQEDVDWLKVRELVEAMGELRTDLELLTIHMAYLDINTGDSPYEVAARWEDLGGKKALK